MRKLLILTALVAALGLLTVLVGCGGGGEAETADTEQVELEAQHAVQEAVTEAAEQAESAEAEEVVEEVVSQLTPEQQAVVDKCVAVSRAVAAAPLQAEKIMAEHGVSSEEYDKMMADISADPAMALAYTTALGKK